METRIQALYVFIYSKLWYLAHLIPFSKSFEKKVDSLTQSFLWGKASAAPIKLDYLQIPKKAGGMGLLAVADKARQIWSKGFLAAIEAESPSPALGRATNWIASMKSKTPFTTSSLKIWMMTHPGLQANRESLAFWKESWRATKQAQWSVKEVAPSEEIDNQRNIQTNSKNFEITQKKCPQPERPKLIRTWTGKGRDLTIPLKDLLHLMNSRLVGASQRITTWRVMNRAYRTDKQCSPSYPYRGCNLCGFPTAGIAHRYFTCPKLRAILKEVYKSLDIPHSMWTHPGQDLFFHKSLPTVPPQLRAILFHKAIWQIHLTQKAKMIHNRDSTALLSCLGFKAQVDKTLERISKFGKLIPEGKRHIANLTTKRSKLFHNYETCQLAFSWSLALNS
ncbi:hypothetical protein DSO57_1009488 [Entomophthora muscae]|uniref:Uncharacterized protein n=1 Tax=Entomophthora muscae TaxID=34485 RepID=A0ACC2UG73_9FUNG|nr:hypothetical protein DSO57_1009488 [Entomophthora muscae]